MRRIILAALFTSIAASAYAQSPPSCTMPGDRQEAGRCGQDELHDEMPDDATTSCNTQADGKKLAGAARTSFTKKCVTDATGT